jgi:hypothetical protein
MNVSEIMDAELRYLAIQGATLAIKSLAQAELDGRSEAKAGPLPRAKYWRHGDTRDGFMTIDGKIEAIMDRGKVSEPKVVKGDKLTCPQCLANEITADEWVAIQRGALWPCQHLHGGVAPYIYQGGCDCSTGLCNHEECKPTKVDTAKSCDCVSSAECGTEKQCDSSVDAWCCTRPRGHKGKHVACVIRENSADNEHGLHVWGYDEKPTERAEIEPWIKIDMCVFYNSTQEVVEQLQRRLEAVERRGK